MDIDSKTTQMEDIGCVLKRDNWTNEEVLHLLSEMEFCFDCDQSEPGKYERSEEYTQAIEDVREIFEGFKAPKDSYCAPMAYDTVSGFRVYVGPPLPAC